MLAAAGSTLSATSTASGDYDVNNLHNMLETNMWKAASAASPHYILYDAGVGSAKAADYICVIGHNLKSAGASIVLEYSNDNAGYTAALTDAPAADTVYLREFANPGPFRYWRLKMTGMSIVPYMTLCIWGLKTELDYATADFDPHEHSWKASVNQSQGGYITGVHAQYAERQLSLKFEDADTALYTAVKAWWDASGLKNFFVAWEIANNPNDVYLMRPDTRFVNPLTNGGLYRNITINLTGRKE